MAHVLEAFVDLNRTRAQGFAPCAITYTELACWMALTGRELLPWEVDALMALDNEHLRSLRAR